MKKRRKPIKRYARLQAGKPPKRGAPPKRKTPLKPRGKKGSRFPKRRHKAFTAWVAGFPCLLRTLWSGCWHPRELVRLGRFSDPAHVGKTRGAGAGDVGEVVNLCRRHHRQQEGDTAGFNNRYGVDLKRAAMALWIRYEREHGEPVL